MSKGRISFIVSDIKNDINTFFQLISGKKKIDKARVKYVFKTLKENYVEIFKENYIMYLLMIGSFICGAFIASQYYQIEATNMVNSILDNYYCTPKEVLFLNNFTLP